MSRRVEIGRFAPMPRPTPRRLSDINPYAQLSRDPDRAVGAGLAVVAAALVILILLGVIQ